MGIGQTPGIPLGPEDAEECVIVVLAVAKLGLSHYPLLAHADLAQRPLFCRVVDRRV